MVEPPMPWPKIWQDIRERVDAQKDHRLTLTIDEIQEAAGSGDNLDKQWWWQMVSDQTMVSCVPPAHFGIHCKPRTSNGRVVSVTFTRTKNVAP
jgi:hypothetical protein